MKSVMNNVLVGEADLAEMERAGLVEAGVARISQRALRKFLDAQAEVERVASMLRFALLHGADVEGGDLDCGLYREMERRPNWRQSFVDLGGDPVVVVAATPKVASAPRLRVHETSEKQKGERVAPTANGQPLADVGANQAGCEAEAA